MRAFVLIAALSVLLSACGPIHIRRATGATEIPPVDFVQWRRDRGHDRDRWERRRGPRCDVVRQVCRNMHGYGWDFRQCVRNRGCHPWGM